MKKLYFLVTFCLGLFTNAQIVNIPDANFKAKLLLASPTQNIAYNAAGTKIKIDTNNDNEIQISEAQQVFRLVVSSSSITDLTGIQSFTNLILLNCAYNQLTNLDVSSSTGLTNLNCSNNLLTSLNISSLSALTFLDCFNNQLETIDVSTNVALVELYCSKNQLTTLDVSGLFAIKKLSCSNNSLVSLDLNDQINLESLYCISNIISELILNPMTYNLTILQIDSNNLTSFNFNDFPTVKNLSCGGNPYSSTINIDNLMINLISLDVSNLPLSLLPINNSNAANFTSLSSLSLKSIDFQGQLNSFNFNLFPALYNLYLTNSILNQTSSISSTTITGLGVSDTDITTLDLSNLPNLQIVEAENTQLNDVIFNYAAPLNKFYGEIAVSYPTPPTITSLDFSQFTNMNFIDVSGWNQLTTLNVKNGLNGGLFFQNCSNLQYICADESEITSIQNNITTYGYTNCHVNTFCTFEPGGTFYTIQGTNKYDFNTNGCDSNDINVSNLKLNLTSGSVLGSVFGNFTGSYNVPVQAGTHVITPQLENPTYFAITPTSSSVTFPSTASPFTQDFCITPNGVHNDLEVVILPLTSARPGFDATYKIIYKNKGTNSQSGTVSLDFYDPIMDLVSANPNFSNQATNTFNWSFTNLLPFETREIQVIFNLNSPTETPAINAGNGIIYTATIIGSTDETIENNTSVLNQIVVNSFDPNDKTCTEGPLLPTYKVGSYVNYIIRFENNGTANAQNIVVKDIIDTTKFDVSTLIPIDGSHDFYTRLSNNNQVEFIFENINLPFDDANNDGYIAFKIKTKSTLVDGDVCSNSANIYFDYNFPIVTNTYSTVVFEPLTNLDFEFSDYFTLSPVPTKDVLYFEMNQRIEVSSINIYNILGQLILVETNPSNQIDVSNLKTGNYFIKVISDKGISVGKFVKQ